MKQKLTIAFLFLFCLTSASFSQETTGYRQPASKKAIPQEVQSAFMSIYPDVLVKGWFVTHLVYWQNDYSSGWYSDWYGARTITVYTYQKPTYYEVEFEDQPGELSRAIFNVYGYWYETRTQIKGFPLDVKESLKNSEYGLWKISPIREKMESPAWPLPIYRFKVSKGLRAKIIRIDEKGTIIQLKELEYED
jgi:hypothetical protein